MPVWFIDFTQRGVRLHLQPNYELKYVEGVRVGVHLPPGEHEIAVSLLSANHTVLLTHVCALTVRSYESAVQALAVGVHMVTPFQNETIFVPSTTVEWSQPLQLLLQNAFWAHVFVEVEVANALKGEQEGSTMLLFLCPQRVDEWEECIQQELHEPHFASAEANTTIRLALGRWRISARVLDRRSLAVVAEKHSYVTVSGVVADIDLPTACAARSECRIGLRLRSALSGEALDGFHLRSRAQSTEAITRADCVEEGEGRYVTVYTFADVGRSASTFASPRPRSPHARAKLALACRLGPCEFIHEPVASGTTSSSRSSTLAAA
jgi:hypothetical protein